MTRPQTTRGLSSRIFYWINLRIKQVLCVGYCDVVFHGDSLSQKCSKFRCEESFWVNFHHRNWWCLKIQFKKLKRVWKCLNFRPSEISGTWNRIQICLSWSLKPWNFTPLSTPPPNNFHVFSFHIQFLTESSTFRFCIQHRLFNSTNSLKHFSMSFSFSPPARLME